MFSFIVRRLQIWLVTLAANPHHLAHAQCQGQVGDCGWLRHGCKGCIAVVGNEVLAYNTDVFASHHGLTLIHHGHGVAVAADLQSPDREGKS